MNEERDKRRKTMKAKVVYNRDECSEAITDEVDIIVLGNRLVGIFLYVTNEELMTVLYSNFRWVYCELDRCLSLFFFGDITREQLLELLREKIEGLEVFDPHEECVQG